MNEAVNVYREDETLLLYHIRVSTAQPYNIRYTYDPLQV